MPIEEFAHEGRAGCARFVSAATGGSGGVSRQTISAVEKGNYNPTIKLCVAICRALGKTLDELFWESAED